MASLSVTLTGYRLGRPPQLQVRQLITTRSSESDGRSDVTDCLDLRFISLIALIGLDWPDSFIIP